MDPITLLVLAAVGIAAKAATVTWRTISNWLNANRIPGGTARIIKERLKNGDYKVVSGVFSAQDTLRVNHAWQAHKLDSELASEFERGGGVIVVKF
jgi:hypothetical protein